MSKLNVAVLFGGCSSEYNVSLASAHAVIKAMDREAYNPVMVGISREGHWYCFQGEIGKIKDGSWCGGADCIPATFLPDRDSHKLILMRDTSLEVIPIDVVFPVLHGKNGEDGTVQGFVELMGLPMVGCGVLSSALCMDKDRAHRLARAAGVQAPEAIVISAGEPEERAQVFAAGIGYPVFVKPVRGGSSYGITKVQTEEELHSAIQLALQYDTQVILEETIQGFEVGCAVIGNRDLIVGEVDEIQVESGFFDFAEKYTDRTATIYVPARISSAKSAQIKTAARTIYKALDCKGFARVDMFLTPEGEIVFNEVNTIPGITEQSRFPNMMKAAGVSLSEVVSKVIELAVEQ